MRISFRFYWPTVEDAFKEIFIRKRQYKLMYNYGLTIDFVVVINILFIQLIYARLYNFLIIF